MVFKLCSSRSKQHHTEKERTAAASTNMAMGCGGVKSEKNYKVGKTVEVSQF